MYPHSSEYMVPPGSELGSGMRVEGEPILPLRDILRIIRKRLWLILLITLMIVGFVVAFSLQRTPIYEASIKILVGQERGTTTEGVGGEVQGLQQLTQTMAEGVSTRPVANAVIEQQDLQMTPEDFLQNHLSVEQIAATQYIQINYRDPSPERAQSVANNIGEAFSEQVSEVSPSANDVTVTVWEPAEVPDNPVSPNLVFNTGLGLAIGLMLGVGLAFLREYLDDSWRSAEEAEQVSGIPTLGVIPKLQKDKEAGEFSGRLISVLDPASAASEAYRSLRTNLLYSFVDNPPKVIVLTSHGPQEGKSTTCANLGIALAQANKSTLILDCDLRKPVLHTAFGKRNIIGIVDVLAGEYKLQDVWHEPVPGLKVVTVGPIPPNPAELLGSNRLSDLLANVRKEFDYVLIDAPPVGLVSDPAILATQGDGALLIFDAQKTRKASLKRSLRSLQSVGANVLGTVMNNSKIAKEGYYYGDYSGYTYSK